jgi:hypothetical protein
LGGNLNVVSAQGSASMTHETRFGNASIDWSLARGSSGGGGSLTMTCTVPAGASAEVHIPMLPEIGGKDIAITDGTKTVWKAGAFVAGSAGVNGGLVKDEAPWSAHDTVVLSVSSGVFPFKATK